MKSRFVAVVLVVAALLLSTHAVQALVIPDDLMIRLPESEVRTADWIKGVKFKHAMHATVAACRDCHHMQTDDPVGNFASCTDCHSAGQSKEPDSYYAAWHGKTTASCMGCHTSLMNDGEAHGPVSCTEGCHDYPNPNM